MSTSPTTGPLEDQPTILIALLGGFRLLIQDKPCHIGHDSPPERLMYTLALSPAQRVPRETLLERVWPNSGANLARQSLNSLVYRLNSKVRKALSGKHLLLHEEGYYRLHLEAGIAIDITQFDESYQTGRCLLEKDSAAGVAYLRHALTLYRGDLTTTSSLRGLIERERLRAAFLDVLTRLASHHFQSGERAQASYYAQQLLLHDPCREDAHRLLMHYFLDQGQRAQALRQYETCREILRVEFDTAPELATAQLYEQIRTCPETVCQAEA